MRTGGDAYENAHAFSRAHADACIHEVGRVGGAGVRGVG